MNQWRVKKQIQCPGDSMYRRLCAHEWGKGHAERKYTALLLTIKTSAARKSTELSRTQLSSFSVLFCSFLLGDDICMTPAVRKVSERASTGMVNSGHVVGEKRMK